MSIRFKLTGDGLLPMNLKWWLPTRKEWTPELQQSQEEYWQQETNAFTGRPWKALTKRYAAKKSILYPGAPILRATGEMQDTMTIKHTAKKFYVHGVDYGKYHQFGTKRMAARPWVGVPEKTMGPLAEFALKNILSRSRYTRHYRI
jgi:phage gpG-like protein